MTFPSLSEPPAASAFPVLSGSSSGEMTPSVGETPSTASRRSRAIVASSALTVVASCLLGWGVYAFLTSIHVFAIVFDGASFINWKAVFAVIAGSLLAFIAVIMAIIAIVRSRPKVLAVVVLLCGVAMPAMTAAGAGHLGGEALQKHTFAEARHYAGEVSPENVDAVLVKVEEMGVSVPWRHDLVALLRESKEGVS